METGGKEVNLRRVREWKHMQWGKPDIVTSCSRLMPPSIQTHGGISQVTQPGQFKRKIKDNWSWLMFGSPLHTEHQLHAYSRSPTIASIGVQLLTWINTLIINYKAQCMPHDERQSKASLKYRRLFLPLGGKEKKLYIINKYINKLLGRAKPQLPGISE